VKKIEVEVADSKTDVIVLSQKSKWLTSMIAKYGSQEAVNLEMHRRAVAGGSHGKIDGVIKGFGANKELTIRASRLGVSKRRFNAAKRFRDEFPE
jgi:hypothetical protein